MKKFTTLLISLSMLATLFVTTLTPIAASAQSNAKAVCEGSGGKWEVNKDVPSGGTCTSPDNRTVPGLFRTLTNVILYLLGAIAVLMLIIGGIRYTSSAGDQAAITGAKNTILYAIIGLVVAFMAYAIVNFVFSAFNVT